MKKKLFLLLITFLLTGCSIKYEINIDDNYNHSEIINIMGKNEYLGLSTPDKIVDFYLKDEGLYNKKKTFIDSNNYEIEVTSSQGNYTIYEQSSAVNYLYTLTINDYSGNRNYLYTLNKKYDQDTFDENSYEKLEIVLTSSHQVVSSNADREENGKYIWNMDKELKDISFAIKLETKVEKTSLEKYMEKNNIKPIYIEMGLLLIVLIVILIIIIKGKRRNKI